MGWLWVVDEFLLAYLGSLLDRGKLLKRNSATIIVKVKKKLKRQKEKLLYMGDSLD